ncbi:MAG: BsuPI-related putative proteinase inhibitor [Candidatus Bipolaricaulota bacterium]|nr:BsuPI-related putative proteinase inhibitor [Candidatus Bipolaricaulota bacterium]
MKLLGLIAFLALALVGCTVLPSGPGVVIGDFMLTLSVEGRARRTQADQGDPISLMLALVNRGRTKILTLRQRPAYDFIVTREDGTEVWRWTHDKTIEALPKEIEFSPWDRWRYYSAVWDQRDNDGFPVPVGQYWVQGVLYTQPRTLFSQRVKLLIWHGSPLRLSVEIPAYRHPYRRRYEGYWKMGQPLPITLKLRNVTDRAIELTLLGRPAYDVAVATSGWPQGQEVWRFSYGQVIQKIAELKRLEPLEELEFLVEWDLRDNAGVPIKPGYYCVEGFLNVEPSAEPTERYCLWIAPELPLRVSLDAPAHARVGESLSLKLKIQNPSDCPLTLLSPYPDFVVTTLDGRVIWSWADYYGRFLLHPHPPPDNYYNILTLQPGEVREYLATWDQFDNEGYPVQAGTYWVYGFFTASQHTNTIQMIQTERQKLVISR